MKAQYNRVSTIEQNESRQSITMGAKVYLDKCSGTIPFKERENGSKLLTDVLSGKVSEINIHSIDRLGRNTLDIMNTLKIFTENGVNVISKKEGFNTLNEDGTENMIAKMMIGILGTLAEFEYNRLKERQREGIDKALKRGVYKNGGKGRPKGKVSIDDYLKTKRSKDILKRLNQGSSLRDTAKLCSCSLSTVQKVAKYADFKREVSENEERTDFDYQPFITE